MSRRGRPPHDADKSIKNRPHRTRQHIVADLSVLHVQLIACRCGFVAERPVVDYGYGLLLFTYSENGEAEGGIIYIQVKATDGLADLVHGNGSFLSYSVERRHLEMWREEPMPVLLVVFDAETEIGYWLYVQPYLQKEFVAIPSDQSAVSLRIPMNNVLDREAMKRIRNAKANILRQLREVSHHEG